MRSTERRLRRGGGEEGRRGGGRRGGGKEGRREGGKEGRKGRRGTKERMIPCWERGQYHIKDLQYNLPADYVHEVMGEGAERGTHT